MILYEVFINFILNKRQSGHYLKTAKDLFDKKASFSNPIIQSMVYSWDYFDMSFDQQADFSSMQSYVPNGFIELVFLKNLQVYEAVYDEPFQQLPPSFVWGQTKRGNKVVVTGTGKWFEVKLYPWAFNVLFGHSSASLPPGSTPLKDLNKGFEQLSEQIAQAQSSAQALPIFEQFVLQQLHTAKTIKPFLIHAYNMIFDSHGQVKVSEICDAVNVSRQHIHQYFKEKIGLSPKAYAKIVRLRHTVDTIYTHKNKSLTQIALDAGYFDQAHFISDFKAILGQTPRSFFQQKQFIIWDL